MQRRECKELPERFYYHVLTCPIIRCKSLCYDTKEKRKWFRSRKDFTKFKKTGNIPKNYDFGRMEKCRFRCPWCPEEEEEEERDEEVRPSLTMYRKGIFTIERIVPKGTPLPNSGDMACFTFKDHPSQLNFTDAPESIVKSFRYKNE